LPLAQAGTLPQAPDRKRDLDVRVAVAVTVGWQGSRLDRSRRDLGLVRIQASVATSAKIVVGPELDQETAITSHHFP
jgi:hypothetical protein